MKKGDFDMNVEMMRIADGGRTETGRWSVKIIYPHFDNDTAMGMCNLFYEKAVNKLVQQAMERGITVTFEMKITYINDQRVSLCGDLLCYRDRKLITMKRFSDNRDNKGILIQNPKKIHFRGYDGWYEEENNIVLYKNTFISGMEEGIRRSEYGRLIAENRIPKNKKCNT